jgi:hypothetical protein
MNRVFYHWRTRAGIFTITAQPGMPDRVWLCFNDNALGSYASAVMAADDVYMKATGESDWDMSNEDGPMDLSEWHRGAPGNG